MSSDFSNICCKISNFNKERVSVLYVIHNLIDRIKHQAKNKGKKTTEMLEKCGINKNMLSTMNTRGSWIQANNLGMIADYLDCSVDYLLCRTENPDSHNTHVGDIILNSRDDQQLIALCKIYDQLDVVAKAKLVSYADELNSSNIQENEGKTMGKFLNGSNGTGEKILQNFDSFSYSFKEHEQSSDGSILYRFTWAFNSQHGHISIRIKENKISNSSLIACDGNSPHQFGRPLGLYNDESLGKLFVEMMKQSCGIVITGFYST